LDFRIGYVSAVPGAQEICGIGYNRAGLRDTRIMGSFPQRRRPPAKRLLMYCD